MNNDDIFVGMRVRFAHPEHTNIHYLGKVGTVLEARGRSWWIRLDDPVEAHIPEVTGHADQLEPALERPAFASLEEADAWLEAHT